jgi:hypothetical protein
VGHGRVGDPDTATVSRGLRIAAMASRFDAGGPLLSSSHKLSSDLNGAVMILEHLEDARTCKGHRRDGEARLQV